MLPPWDASADATAWKARAVTGLPRSTTACVDGRRPPELAPHLDMHVDSDRVHGLFDHFLYVLRVARARNQYPRVSRPRMTTCSTSRRLTRWPASAPMRSRSHRACRAR